MEGLTKRVEELEQWASMCGLEEIRDRIQAIEWLRRREFLGNEHLSSHLRLDETYSRLGQLKKEVSDLSKEIEAIRLAILRLASDTSVHDILK